jgi:two-component system sensor kinase FixL
MFSDAAESMGKDTLFQGLHTSGLLHELLSQLVAVLSVRRAHIAAAAGDEFVRLVAAWQDGAPAQTHDYPITNTPCATALVSKSHTVINSEDDLFPHLHILGADPIRGYVSHPVVAASGEVIGHICLLSNSPIPEGSEVELPLSLAAGRIAAEFEHERRDRDSSSQIRDVHGLLANLPGMVFRCRNEPGWPMQYVSNGSITLSGYSPEQLIEGRPAWREVIHHDDREAVWQSIQNALRTGECFENQYRIITNEKQCKWVLERGCTVGSDNGGILLEGFVSDITPLRTKEIQLKQAEGLSRSVVESIADGVVLIASTGRIELMNNAAMQIFGIQDSRVAGRSVHDFLRGSDYLRIEAEDLQFNDCNEDLLFGSGVEVTGIRADQSVFPIHIRMRQMPIESGASYVASIRDLSEEKAGQAKILQQNEKLNATIDFSPMGIATFDRDLRFIAANTAFSEMIGFEVDEIVGSEFATFTHPDEIAKTTEAVSNSLTDNVRHFTIRTRYVHKDGHIVPAALHVALGYDVNGRPEFGVANIENLTTRLSAAALIKDQQNELARLDRLSSLGEMTAGIAHEINQPLTAISTYAQAAVRFLKQGSPGSDRLEEALVKLSQQSRRASAIVEKIRALSRQGTTKTELIDCNELVSRAIELLDDVARSEVEFRLELAPDLPAVLCEPIQIQQVVLNLIRNAVESMRRAVFRFGKDIILRTETTGTGDVRISVVDLGEGIDDSSAESLFRPFSSDAPTGLGMGLSTSKTILKSIGGNIGYQNNKFEGATFSMTLPGYEGENSDG